MPNEDPRADGSMRDRLRVGGWLETLQGRRALPGRPPLVTPPPPRVPVFRPLRPGTSQRRPAALPVAAFARVENPHQVRLRVAVTCLAAATIGTAAFLVLADRAGTAPAIQQMAVADPVTMAAFPPPASPPPTPAFTRPSRTPSSNTPASNTPASNAPASNAPAGSAPAGSPSATSTAVVRRKTPAVHPTSTPPRAHPVVGGLRAGQTVSLGVLGRSGLRVRHQNFVGRVDRIGPASTALDHADSTFVVRAASTSGCVALESVNYPGFFLRHRDFVIHLDRADGSALFRLDSAFCPVAAGGGSFRLRSADYPDRFVTAVRSGLYLAEVPAARATEFAVRTPY
jgi:hypothetical protein